MSINLREFFINWYTTIMKSEFVTSLNMHTTIEDSPYHREENVFVHTQMVVQQYLDITSHLEWSFEDFCAALAAATHDWGKPRAKEVVTREDGSTYNRFGGHEKISACLWRDYFINNYRNDFKELLLKYDEHDLFFNVAWMVENHLPFSIKDKHKRGVLREHMNRTNLLIPFCHFVMADTRGRISDDHTTKITNTQKWIEEFIFDTNVLPDRKPYDDRKDVIMLIGVSGSGKSTFFNKGLKHIDGVAYYSFDDLRLKWYNSEHTDIKQKYQDVATQSFDDPNFDKQAQEQFYYLMGKQTNKLIWNTGFDTIVVDNTNLTAKSRKFFVTAAKQKRYKLSAIVFVNSLDELKSRQNTRDDKHLSDQLVEDMFFRMSVPSFGDFDHIQFEFAK